MEDENERKGERGGALTGAAAWQNGALASANGANALGEDPSNQGATAGDPSVALSGGVARIIVRSASDGNVRGATLKGWSRSSHVSNSDSEDNRWSASASARAMTTEVGASQHQSNEQPPSGIPAAASAQQSAARAKSATGLVPRVQQAGTGTLDQVFAGGERGGEGEENGQVEGCGNVCKGVGARWGWAMQLLEEGEREGEGWRVREGKEAAGVSACRCCGGKEFTWEELQEATNGFAIRK